MRYVAFALAHLMSSLALATGHPPDLKVLCMQSVGSELKGSKHEFISERAVLQLTPSVRLTFTFEERDPTRVPGRLELSSIANLETAITRNMTDVVPTARTEEVSEFRFETTPQGSVYIRTTSGEPLEISCFFLAEHG